MPTLPIGDPRGSGDASEPVGDTRPTGDTSAAGDPRPTGNPDPPQAASSHYTFGEQPPPDEQPPPPDEGGALPEVDVPIGVEPIDETVETVVEPPRLP